MEPKIAFIYYYRDIFLQKFWIPIWKREYGGYQTSPSVAMSIDLVYRNGV